MAAVSDMPEATLRFEDVSLVDDQDGGHASAGEASADMAKATAASASAEGLHEVRKEQFSFKKVLDGKEFTFVGNTWAPQGLDKPRFLVFLGHGYAEYLSAQYEHVARFFAARGGLVFGHDHLGHGRSSGSRVMTVGSFSVTYMGPVLDHCRTRRAAYPDVPLFAVGHSMGGFILLLASLADPDLFKGLVLVGPALEVDPDLATPFNMFLARTLAWMWPSFSSKWVAGIDERLVTRDEKWVATINKDKLHYHGGFKAKQSNDFLVSLRAFANEMEHVTTAFLVQQGGSDKICRPEGAQLLYEKAKATDKSLKVYPEAYHNLYIELEPIPQDTLADGFNWIKERL